jgi:hypothetical protein
LQTPALPPQTLLGEEEKEEGDGGWVSHELKDMWGLGVVSRSNERHLTSPARIKYKEACSNQRKINVFLITLKYRITKNYECIF